jgi:hypothetical protein
MAGLLAILSAVYAVSFGLESPSFGTFTLLGITIGFGVSFASRWKHSLLSRLQVPIFLLLVALVIYLFISERGLEWLWPASAIGERQKAVQVILVWLSLFLSFLLGSNGAVLFSIVPSFAMLALASQTSTEAEIQNSFLFFVTSTTFLLVHDNYLRTRQFQARGRTENQERQLFGGQFQLAALCVVGALVFANFVAAPLRTIGVTLFNPGSIGTLNNNTDKANQSASSSLQVAENSSVELATGPVNVSDLVLMRVISARGLYWRGTTFDYYTGKSFENKRATRVVVQAADPMASVQMKEQEYRSLGGNAPERTLNGRLYVVPNSRLEIPTLEMENPQTIVQTFRIVGGSFSQLYGATTVSQVLANVQRFEVQESGGLLTGVALGQNFDYQVTSTVPDDDPDHLRRASSDPQDIPPAIRDQYLQLPNNNPNLRRIVDSVVQGKTTNYDKAQALAEYIGKTTKYNLQAPAAPRDRDIVEYFLLDSKMGYCDSFGAAVVVLCRYAGIPARLVSGFLPGDFKEGAYIVKERHKHIWAEVFFPKIGWVLFDATELSEDVSDYSSLNKREMPGFIKWLARDGFRVFVGIIIVGLVLFIFKNEILNRIRRKSNVSPHQDRPDTNREIIALYLNGSRLLQRYGIHRAPSLTPSEFVEAVRQRAERVPTVVTPWEGLTSLFSRYRYGKMTASPEEVQQARTCMAELSVALKKGGRKAFKEAPSAKGRT